MEANFWHEKWESGAIAFHQTQVNPALLTHGPAFFGKEHRVLVPLCGKTADLLWLSERTDRVSGVELSGRAIGDFFAENKLQAEKTSLVNGTRSIAGNIALYEYNFFDFPGEEDGIKYDRVYDRAALVALPEDMRRKYAAALLDLLAPGAAVLLVVLEYDQSEMQGPPFSVSPAHIEELFAARCEIEFLGVEDLKDDKLFSRGITWLKEHAVRLTLRPA